VNGPGTRLRERLRSAAHRLAGTLSRPFTARRRAADFPAELESHLAMRADELEAKGLPAAEARRRAALELGGIERTRQAHRDQATLPWLEQAFQDVRFALRLQQRFLPLPRIRFSGPA